MTERRLTIEEHAELAAQLSKMNETLVKMSVKLGGTYGVMSKEYQRAGKAEEQINQLRNVLDERLFNENPEHYQIAWYYGNLERALGATK